MRTAARALTIDVEARIPGARGKMWARVEVTVGRNVCIACGEWLVDGDADAALMHGRAEAERWLLELRAQPGGGATVWATCGGCGRRDYRHLRTHCPNDCVSARCPDRGERVTYKAPGAPAP